MDAPLSPLWRAAALLGVASSALLACAFLDLAPGGWRVRSLFEDPAAAGRRRAALHLFERLGALRAEPPGAAHGALLFLGSSTIERFPLEACFPGKRVLQHGLADASLELLERTLDCSLPASAPEGVLLYAGSLDLREPREPFEQALERLPRIVQALRVRTHAPALPITLLGLLPARGEDAAALERLAKANESLRVLAREQNLGFVPTARPPLAAADGTLAPELSADERHLNAEGYRILARWIVEEGGEAGRKLAP